MYWVRNLHALALCALAAVWAFPREAMEKLGLLFALLGLTDAYAGLQAWLGAHPEVMEFIGPSILAGLAILALLAANLGPAVRARFARNPIQILFDPSDREKQYVHHDVWRGPANEPLSGMAYRVGIRNNTRSALRDVRVTVDLRDAKPSAARFAKDKSYTSDIGPRSTELVEVFMLRDQDLKERVVETVNLRVSAANMKQISGVFRFDSKAPIPLARA